MKPTLQTVSHVEVLERAAWTLLRDAEPADRQLAQTLIEAAIRVAVGGSADLPERVRKPVLAWANGRKKPITVQQQNREIYWHVIGAHNPKEGGGLGLPLGDTANPDGGAFVRVAREVGKSAKQVERIFYKQGRLAGR